MDIFFSDLGHVITPQPVCVVVPRDISEYEELLPGNEDSRTLQPQESWNTFFSHPEASFVRLNFSVPHSSRLALLARKNAPPSITSYDIMEVIGDELRRYVRGVLVSFKITNIVCCCCRVSRPYCTVFEPGTGKSTLLPFGHQAINFV